MMENALFLKALALGFGLISLSETSHAQTRLILNGAKLNIANGANLVIANPNANAITRSQNGGHLISEGENNAVKWNIGTTTGNYTVPFGFGNAEYLPVSFTKAAGAGTGTFTFSTYRTTWQNSQRLPAGITNLAGAEPDNSANVLDRFWQLNAQDYATKPALTDLMFTYADVEHQATGNTIAESNLAAQRWNSVTQTWGDYGPTGDVNTTANTVRVASVPSADLFNWWVLVGRNTPLPLTFISFEAKKSGQVVKLDWKTVNEVNCLDFEIQRSADGLDFTTIGRTKAVGGSHEQQYLYTDFAPHTGTSFYRIKQNDLDGSFAFTGVRSIEYNNEALVQVYPNPAENHKLTILPGNLPAGEYTISLFDLKGSRVFTTKRTINGLSIEMDFTGKVKSGMYLLRIWNPGMDVQTKVQFN